MKIIKTFIHDDYAIILTDNRDVGEGAFGRFLYMGNVKCAWIDAENMPRFANECTCTLRDKMELVSVPLSSGAVYTIKREVKEFLCTQDIASGKESKGARATYIYYDSALRDIILRDLIKYNGQFYDADTLEPVGGSMENVKKADADARKTFAQYLKKRSSLIKKLNDIKDLMNDQTKVYTYAILQHSLE